MYLTRRETGHEYSQYIYAALVIPLGEGYGLSEKSDALVV